MNPEPYLRYYEDLGRATSSINATRRSVRAFADYIGDDPITGKALMEYRDALRGSPADINKHLSCIKGYLSWLRVREEVPLPDSELVRLALAPVAGTKTIPVVLTRSEIRSTITALSAREPDSVAWFIALALLTGMRPGEVMALAPQDYIPGRGIMVSQKKTRSQRVVPVNDSPLLQRLLTGKASRYVDLPLSGTTRRAFDAFMQSAIGRAIAPKTFRSTHAAYLLSSGKVDPASYSFRLGHTLSVCQRHYVQLKVDGVTGSTVEEYLGCPEDFEVLVDRMTGIPTPVSP